MSTDRLRDAIARVVASDWRHAQAAADAILVLPEMVAALRCVKACQDFALAARSEKYRRIYLDHPWAEMTAILVATDACEEAQK